ncbi:prolyl oligopeptidase family serine peptidase [Sinomonas atrocyanea]
MSVMERLFSTAVGASASIALMERAPRIFARMVLGNPPGVPSSVMASRARGVLDDQVHMAGLRALFRSAYSHWPERRRGYRNDVDLVTRLGRLPLEEITCPTLIVHGTADTSVPPGQAEHAHARIAGSELYWVKDGEHVGALLNEQDRAQTRITEWLRAQERQRAP